MDRFNGLSDELLVKILSFLPTKDAVSTSILSKRWEFHWMWLTKLGFRKRLISESEFNMLSCFLDRNLPLHRAPVIKSFRLELSGSHIRPEDIRMWVVVVVSRYVRELEICVPCYPNKHNILPSSLYTSESLVILKLHGRMLLDVPRMVFLPSLKTLELKIVRYSSEGSLQRLLSNCPVLEDLLVDLHHSDNKGKFTIIVPSLHRLSLDIRCDLDGFVIDTPSLKYFKLVDRSSNGHTYLIENMPKLVEAYVDVKSTDLKTLFRLITSVKVLTIHLKLVYDDGFIFNHLEHLRLYVREKYSSNFLVRFLKNSPNLREIKYISKVHDYEDLAMFSWTQPSNVPECMVSSLQDFTWSQYLGRPEDIAIAVYILKNAPRLRIATIFSDTRLVPKLEMVKELARSSRASTTCVLNFY